MSPIRLLPLSLVLLAGACGTGPGVHPVAVVPAAAAQATPPPWFAESVGNATQVVSVQGTGGTKAVIGTWQRSGDTWEPVEQNLPSDVGSAGFAATASDDNPATPTGIFSLDYAFGTEPSVAHDLNYVQVDADDWWDGDPASPGYNTHQRCAQSACAFDTSLSEELDGYSRAIVMGVNASHTPGGGSAFFVHASDGGPSAGCVTLDDAALVRLIGWLRPGAVIAIKG
ncbi:L,D-transpeptidase [Mycobacteriaceae bacterium NPDC060252]